MKKNLYLLHEELVDIHWWFRGRQKIILRLINKVLPEQKGIKILDTGCGTGEFFPLLKEYGKVQGIDTAEEAVESCQKRDYQTAFGSILNIPFPENTFNLVLALDVIEHIEDDFLAVQELNRVTKPNGLIFITVPAYQFLWSGHDEVNEHKRRYTATRLKKLGESNRLKLIKLSYFNTFLAIPIILIRLFKKILKRGRADLEKTNYILNSILKMIFSAESFLLKKINFPFGISILAIFQKK